MITFLTHYYRQGDTPFRSLSALSDSDAIQVMESLYVDNPVADRFKEPAQYLHNRRQAEQWVRSEFIAQGEIPKKIIHSMQCWATLNGWKITCLPLN